MSDFFVGEIRLLAFNQFAPVNFLPCDGRLVSVSQYQTLFTLIGTAYGGDGVSTFGLPDLRGRTPVNFGQTVNGSNYVLAQSAGLETVTLSPATAPPHTHTVSVVNTAATMMVPSATATPGSVGSNFYYCNQVQAGSDLNLAADTVSQSGGGNAPHLNLQPSLVLAYVIAMNGRFPVFNT
jgi:microcystin-dependent protein